ncbi:endo-1,4-beta-xylanase [Paenibacillus sedimenti]|nr:endo-1,4-beta-xylanase [Paenibacillus sedimenti]
MVSKFLTGMILSFVLLLSAVMPQSSAIAAGTPEPVLSSDFEDGTSQGWTPRGSVSLTVNSNEKQGGDSSLHVDNRQATWHGASHDLTGSLNSGQKVHVSAWVMFNNGPAEQTLSLSFQRGFTSSSGKSDKYDNAAQVKAVKGVWTKLEGDYTVPVDADMNRISIYFETPWNSAPTLDDLIGFYLDDIAVTPVSASGSGNVVFASDFEDGTKGAWGPRAGETLTVVNSVKHSGNFSLEVSNRTATFNGPSRSLFGMVKPGKMYHVSMWAMYKEGPASQGVSGSLEKEFNHDAGSRKYETFTTVNLNKGEWKQIQGDIIIPDDSTLSDIKLYAETPWKPDNQTTPSDLITFYIDDVTVTESAIIDIQRDIPDLHSVLDPYFPIGAAIDPVDVLNASDIHSALIKKHFKSLTAGNFMKPDALQPVEGNFVWTNADKLVQFAEANDMLVRGHTLLWHNQIPAWFFTDPADSGKPATREQLLARLETHIKTVVSRYKGRIQHWDVVNEVLNEDGGLRGADTGSKWKGIIGDVDGDGYDSDYIELAFKYAHEADPDAKLVINDYNLESSNAKLNGMAALVKRLLAKGLPVHSVGFQMHISNTAPSIEQMRSAMEKIAALGVKIQSTELDISIYSNSTESEKPVTDDILLEQAKRYRELFEMYKQGAQKGYLESVTIWGMADDGTWLDNFPVKGRKDAPLLFDRQLQAKPAYWGIVDPSKLPVYRNQIRAAQGTPVIGSGAYPAWSALKPVSVDTLVSGQQGATAEAKIMWDDNHLYVQLQVRDSTPNNNDSIEIFIDPNYDKSSMYLPDDLHYTIGFNGNGPADIQRTVTAIPGGYVVHAAISLSKDGAALSKGDKLGIDFRVNDDQGGGAVASSAVWNDYTNHQNTDPSKFGDVDLGNAVKMTETIYGTPVIDAVFDELWSNGHAISTEIWVQGTSGSTAVAKTAWDENYLYVIADVTDSLLSKVSRNAYEQDSVELFIDQNKHQSSFYETDDAQYRVNYDNEATFSENGDQPRFKSATKLTDHGYIVETAIPFTAITPEIGMLLGFDLQVNNDHTGSGKRDSVAIWCDPSGSSYRDTSGLGTVQLAPEPITIAYLKKLVNRYAIDGSIDNGGIANSLLKKLEKDNLEPFISEVKAQKGKHIAAAAADVLLRDADKLIH